jgi:hypothetical protein
VFLGLRRVEDDAAGEGGRMTTIAISGIMQRNRALCRRTSAGMVGHVVTGVASDAAVRRIRPGYPYARSGRAAHQERGH